MSTRKPDATPASLSDAHLRRRYQALLRGDPVIGPENRVIDAAYDRWRELKRMAIVYGLPRDEGLFFPTPEDNNTTRTENNGEDGCSLRGRIWKRFLGVEDATIDVLRYQELVQQGASHYDADIRNDTFRTFRGDAKFAERVPEGKLVRLLNAFFNELDAGNSSPDLDQADYIRYVQGMNVLCAPLLYVMPEEDAYHTFCQLILKHCPKYMVAQLKGVENGCVLVDKCLEVIDPELYRHLSSRGITARIYALPLILSLFACVPPLKELLRVWDVLFAVGVHFVVVLAVAHTVLLRSQLLAKDMDLMKILSSRFAPPLESDKLISVALQLLHRLPDDLLYEITRHPLESPDLPESLPFTQETIDEIKKRVVQSTKPRHGVISPKAVAPPPPPVLVRTTSGEKDATSKQKATRVLSPSITPSHAGPTTMQRPPWKL